MGNEKIRQRKTEMVGKQGNAKLLSEITKTEKTKEKTATGKWAAENWATRKFGNKKWQRR